MTDTSHPDSTVPADELGEQTPDELEPTAPDKTATPKTPASHVAGLDERR